MQGLAAAGPGALVTRAQPVFQAVKRAGIAYLAYLGVQALRSARAGHYPESAGGDAGSGWRQGFSVRLATE